LKIKSFLYKEVWIIPGLSLEMFISQDITFSIKEVYGGVCGQFEDSRTSMADKKLSSDPEGTFVQCNYNVSNVDHFDNNQ
jgi:hypothetical protein